MIVHNLYLYSRGAQLKSFEGTNNFFFNLEGPKLISFFTHTNDVLMKKARKKTTTKIWASRARLEASAGLIWTVGRMLCMPAIWE
jgi:hypothetical protein